MTAKGFRNTLVPAGVIPKGLAVDVRMTPLRVPVAEVAAVPCIATCLDLALGFGFTSTVDGVYFSVYGNSPLAMFAGPWFLQLQLYTDAGPECAGHFSWEFSGTLREDTHFVVQQVATYRFPAPAYNVLATFPVGTSLLLFGGNCSPPYGGRLRAQALLDGAPFCDPVDIIFPVLVYQGSTTDNNVRLWDGEAGTLIATTLVGSDPEGELVMNADKSRLYVPNYLGNSISVIDTVTNLVVNTITGIGDGVQAMLLSPDGLTLYAACKNEFNPSTDQLQKIDVATETITAAINVGEGARGLAFSPDGSVLYVACQDSQYVAVVDVATFAVTFTMPSDTPLNTGGPGITEFPYKIAPSADGLFVYITAQTNDIIKFQAADGATNARIPVDTAGDDMTQLKVRPDGTGALIGALNATGADYLFELEFGGDIVAPKLSGFVFDTVEGIHFNDAGDRLVVATLTQIQVYEWPGLEQRGNANTSYAGDVALLE